MKHIVFLTVMILAAAIMIFVYGGNRREIVSPRSAFDDKGRWYTMEVAR